MLYRDVVYSFGVSYSDGGYLRRWLRFEDAQSREGL